MSENLTTFEENYKEWNSKHPTRSPDRWVATTDRREAAQFIADQTDEITKTQLKAANDIIASQESVKKEVEDVSRGVDRLAVGLEGLQATFDWGFSELIWQIEKQRETLQEILETLQKPLDTQAKELKKRAEKAYKNGWFEDALQDFLESEKKNKYDFTVHHNLGNIYFFHKGDPDKSLEYYKKAVKYAKPESSPHASFSLLHLAKVKYLQEKFCEAYEATKEAISLTPDLGETHYQHSVHCVKTGDIDEALEELQVATYIDKLYAPKADANEVFDGIKDKIYSQHEKISQKYINLAERKKEKAKKMAKKARHKVKPNKHSGKKNIGNWVEEEIRKDEPELPIISDIQAKISESSKLLKEETLFASRKAVDLLSETLDDGRESLEKLISFWYGQLDRDKLSPLKDKIAEKGGWVFFFLVAFILFIWGISGGSIVAITFSGIGAYLIKDWVVGPTIAFISSPIISHKISERDEELQSVIDKCQNEFPWLWSKVGRVGYGPKIELKEDRYYLSLNSDEEYGAWQKQIENADSTPIRNIIFEADAKKIVGPPGSYGLCFRMQGNKWYSFSLTTEGDFMLHKHLDNKQDEWETIIKKTSSPHINEGKQWNHLRVVAGDNTLGLYANDYKLDEVYEESLDRGFLGVSCERFKAVKFGVLFDNVEIYTLRQY